MDAAEPEQPVCGRPGPISKRTSRGERTEEGDDADPGKILHDLFQVFIGLAEADEYV